MDSEKLYRCTGNVRGKVQGVFFRAETRRKALTLGVRGWVRNCPDGSVEFELIGTEDQLSSMERWLRRGPPLASVDQLTLGSKASILAENSAQDEAKVEGFTITRR